MTDTVLGDGDNLYFGSEQHDNIHGGGGNDRISGLAGADAIYGDSGNDEIFGNDGRDRLFGGDGNDTLYADPGEVVKGGAGDDLIVIGIGSGLNPATGGLGIDGLQMTLDATITPLQGMRTRETVGGYEITSDGAVVATVTGFEYYVVVGSELSDRLEGGALGDVLQGARPLSAATDRDTLVGFSGDDRLFGQGGRDVLRGGEGNDELHGGANGDALHGGAGDDRFVYYDSWDSNAVSDRDVIADFTHGEDRIDVKFMDAIGSTRRDDRFVFIGDAEFSGALGELRVVQQDGITLVEGNIFADSAADFQIELTGLMTLVRHDFLL